ncbi:MAG TPA: 3-hydroxyacyl-CoA dehydrogenase NAD-binding domain-containing protein [Gaiellaceae bacterium]|nr:3-hydroxyacyl-CoA dehydrogenase NAD-binding domain-containing protein [Gaiellaceae bacterium]
MPTEFKLRRVGRIAILTVDNGEDHTKPTTLDLAAFDSLGRALDELEAEPVDGLLLTGKPFVFCAGADIGMFEAAQGPEDALEITRRGHEQLARLRALSFPTVAAINGACLGGGVELALHCDARTIAANVRHFASPECFLGIVPGWGGTQLIPRLVGARTAVQFVVENAMERNRMIEARTAHELGFADRLLEPVEFVDESLAYLRELVADGFAREDADLSDAAEVCRKARARLDGSLFGAAPAPYRALDLIEGAATWSIEEGYRQEEEASAELGRTRQAEASIYAFGLTQFRAKRPLPLEAEPCRIHKVGIVGAGLMATQIATQILRRLEVPIVMRDLSQEIVDRAVAEVGAAQKGRRAGFLASIVQGTTGWEELADCDLVLEAVFEEMSVKHEVLRALEPVVREDCAIATNTSSLSLAGMASVLARPERFVGIHFFNPVAVMPLVELGRAERTGDEALATAAALVRKLRKTAVLVADAPGFVVNRMFARMSSVTGEALDHGTPGEVVDESMLRLGMPMAPSVLVQMVGPKVANHVLHTLHAAYPDRFRLSATLDALAAGEEPAPTGDSPSTWQEVQAAVLEGLADEAARMLGEGVVPEAADIDTCMILGAGWPFWLGGITKFLDQTGVSERVAGRTLGPAAARATA